MFVNYCYIIMFTSEFVDLGFNTLHGDTCDYIDYSPTDSCVTKKNVDLTVMQLNICGLLGKIETLKSLVKDIRRIHNVHIIVSADT